MIRIVELGSSDQDFALLDRAYHELYARQFPNPDERETPEGFKEFLRLKSYGWYGKNNYHFFVALNEDRIVGLSVSDYLHEPNSGVIEFLVTAADDRRIGLGRMLLAHTETALKEDSRSRTGRLLDYVFAEMDDPFAPESQSDSFDPFLRALVWNRWGFRRLDFRYIQPALSARQGPVGNLLLIVKSAPHDSAIASATITTFLREYMRWAMRIDDPATNREFRDMDGRLRRADRVVLQPLCEYVGVDPTRPLTVRDVMDPSDRDWAATLAVYGALFPDGATNVDASEFQRFAGGNFEPGFIYHLWSVRGEADGPVEGMASFFAFPRFGFGGYIGLVGSLRGTHRLRLLLALCEERMRRDMPDAAGWYIECNPQNAGLFARLGFCTVEVAYRQPPLKPGTPESCDLTLMYKTFGRAYGPPRIAREQFLAAIAEIFHVVYGIDADSSDQYANLRTQAGLWPSGFVPWR